MWERKESEARMAAKTKPHCAEINSAARDFLAKGAEVLGGTVMGIGPASGRTRKVWLGEDSETESLIREAATCREA